MSSAPTETASPPPPRSTSPEGSACNEDALSEVSWTSESSAAATAIRVPSIRADRDSPPPAASAKSALTKGFSFAWATAAVWPLMLTMPLVMNSGVVFSNGTGTTKKFYERVFRTEWYEYYCDRSLSLADNTPLPLGLTLGILAVAIGQVFVWIVFYVFKYGYLTRGREPLSIQAKGSRPYEFWEGVTTHASQPEGFALLGGYLCFTWMLRLMPKSYYSFEGGIEWTKLAACLVIQDALQYVMHRLEHDLSAAFYQKSHKMHHRFTNPRLFDAFNGSLTDTLCMVVIPLYATANLVHCNVWTYMAFGSTYANWLTLIHSEYTFPWDRIFHVLGFGTSADHHVHHAFFKYNFGHLFMWFDMLAGTYKDPLDFSPKAFNENI